MVDRCFRTNKISVRYGDVQVFWDIGLTADKGEIVALAGSNGAGKSTVIKSCAGLLRPFQGNTCLDGRDLTGATYKTLIDHGIILVPEGRQLFPSIVIYKNLEMGASSKAAKAAKKDIIEWIYNWSPELKDRKNQLTDTLSGGEQQMLAFPGGMMGLPKLLIMGEPSLGLTPNIVGIVFSIAKEVTQESGLTVILVEQDVRKALRIANRDHVIKNGQITISGTTEELLDNDKVRGAYLGFQSMCGMRMKDGPYMGQSNKRRRNT